MGKNSFEGDDLREAFDAGLLGNVEPTHPTFTQHAADAVSPEALGRLRRFMSLDALHVAPRSSDVGAPDLEAVRAFGAFVCIERVAGSAHDGYSQLAVSGESLEQLREGARRQPNDVEAWYALGAAAAAAGELEE